MRPLGIYVIGISIYILNTIHFMMISGNFGVFSLMLTGIWIDRWTDGRIDRPYYRDASTHLKREKYPTFPCQDIWAVLAPELQYHMKFKSRKAKNRCRTNKQARAGK